MRLSRKEIRAYERKLTKREVKVQIYMSEIMKEQLKRMEKNLQDRRTELEDR